MKMVYLQSIKNYCERFWFTSNVVKLRIALMDYFRQEGIKCKLEDGHVNFDYGDYEFNTEFMVFEDYAECIVESDYEDDDYENLEVKDKALLADQVNIREDNHCVIKAYNDVVEVKTSFYFTNTNLSLPQFFVFFLFLSSKGYIHLCNVLWLQRYSLLSLWLFFNRLSQYY